MRTSNSSRLNQNWNLLLEVIYLNLFTAKVVVELGKSCFIKAAVLPHPSSVSMEDINGMTPSLQYSGTILVNYLINNVYFVVKCVFDTLKNFILLKVVRFPLF